MPKRSSDYVADDGFVEDAADSKRVKTTSGSDFRGAKDDLQEIDTTMQRDDNGDEFWELNRSGNRRITINTFRGKVMVNIREYYESDGKKMPGKKVRMM